MIRIILGVSRYLLAITFIFSGIVKGVDPLGSAYKFGDYFMAFGLDFFMPYALPLAFVLCAAELLIGLLLLFNIRTVLASWGALLFMSVFTPLTLILAIYNPVSDCGCFGDAIVLTNWETFFKNLPLFIASLLLVIHRKKLNTNLTLTVEYIALAILGFASFIPSIDGYRNLPLIDFRPYSIGTNITEAMEFPEGAPVDEYKTILYYEKDGIAKEFSQDNFPWQDSTWTFVDSKSILTKKGYEPPVKDFQLTNLYGWELTDSILSYPGYYILVVAYRLETANIKAFSKLNELYFKAKDQNIGFACVTSSPFDNINKFISQTGVAFPFLQGDEIMLKTPVRSNPGLILLHKGTVIGKWHYNNIPEPSFFEGDMYAKALKASCGKQSKGWIYILVLILVLGKISLVTLFAKKRT